MKKYLKIIIVSLIFVNVYAAAIDWPGTGTCSGSLQSCINASSAGSTINIKTNGTALAGATLTINKDFKLIAAPGYHPKFINVDFSLNVPNTKSITVKGLEFEGASLISAGIGFDANIDIINNNWSDPDSATGQNEGINILASVGSGTSFVNIKGNNIVGEGYNGTNGFIHIYHPLAGEVVANIFDNHVTDNDTFSTNEGLILVRNKIGELVVQMAGNEIRGGKSQLIFSQFDAAGVLAITVFSNLFTGVIDESNVIFTSATNAAIKSTANLGEVYGVFANNTIDGVERVGTVDGIGFDFSGLTTTSTGTLDLFSNIIVNTAQAYIGPASGTFISVSSAGGNIFHESGTTSGLTLDAFDLTADPLFKNEGINYALQNSSPAIDKTDSGNTAILVHGSVYGSMIPDIDADGMRRFKGEFIDAGAYEWGDRHIFHSSTTATIVSALTDTALNADLDANPIVTQIWNYKGFGGVYNNHPVGIYRDGGIWSVFNEDFVVMPTSSQFHVLHPYGKNTDSYNSIDRRVNVIGGAPKIGLDVFALNNNPDRVLFATNYWDGVYNPSSLEVGYRTTENKWFVGNSDGVNMPAGMKYTLYHQDPSRNVFNHIVTTNNVNNNYTWIDHPLLNNTQCALPTVTQSTARFGDAIFEENPFHIGVFYDSSANKWAIFNQSTSEPITVIGVAGGVFNVMVDPQQVYDCTQPPPELMFSDGFEN